MSAPEVHQLLDRLADEAEKVGCRPREFHRPSPPYDRDFVLAWTNDYGYKIPPSAVDWFLWWGGLMPETSVLSPYMVVPYGAGWSLDQEQQIYDQDGYENRSVPYWPDLRDRFWLIGDEPARSVHLSLATGQVFQFHGYANGPEGFGLLAESVADYIELHLRLYERGCIRRVEYGLLYQAPLDGGTIEYPEALDDCGFGSPGIASSE